jgi:hypothetical protein
VRGDIGGQIGRRHRARAARVRAVYVDTAHPDSAVNRSEHYLASGLYPGPLQFKHQNKITLNVLRNARHGSVHSLIGPTDRVGHWLVKRRPAGRRGSSYARLLC